jgi:hypothetical protein
MRLFVLLFLVPLISGGEDVRLLRLSASAYDLAILIPREQFTKDQVLQKMRSFATQQKSRHRLSRLTISFRESDLFYALPEEEFHYRQADYDRQWSDERYVGQVWCFNGEAHAFVKMGSDIAEYQLLGQMNSREFALDGRQVRLVSFRISSGTRTEQLYSLSNPTGEELVTFYAASDPLLTVAQSERVLTILKAALPGARVALIVRPDSVFSLVGGPPLDIFHPPYPHITKETFDSLSFISCFPDNSRSSVDKSCKIAGAVGRLQGPQ